MRRGLLQTLGFLCLCSFAAAQLPPPPARADYIDYVKATPQFRLWRDGRITDFQNTGRLKDGLSPAEVEKVFEIVKSGKVEDMVQEKVWESLSSGCQLSVSTNSTRRSFGLSYTSLAPEGGSTRVGITHAGLFTIIVCSGGRTNTLTVPTPMSYVPGCGDPALGVIKDLEASLFRLARKRREPFQADK